MATNHPQQTPSLAFASTPSLNAQGVTQVFIALRNSYLTADIIVRESLLVEGLRVVTAVLERIKATGGKKD